MKKISILAAIAAMLIFPSCQKENISSASRTTDPVFTATIDNGITRTTVDVPNKKINWIVGDEITVTDAGETSVEYTVESIDTQGKATFTKKSGESSTLGDGPYTAVYGSSPLSTQTYSSSAPSLPMSAQSANTSLTFTASCALMKITLTAADESIKTISVEDDDYNKYTLDCGDGVSIASGATFYLAVPAGGYQYFTFTATDGSECRKWDPYIQVEANHIVPISSINLVFGVYLTCDDLKGDNPKKWDGNTTQIVFGKYSDYEDAVDGEEPLLIKGAKIYKFDNKYYALSDKQIYMEESLASMFSNCNSLTAISFENFDTEDVTSMEFMFRECKKLESLDLSGFDTRYVDEMNQMFCYCEKLRSLTLSENFDTGCVEDMNAMFWGCGSLESLDLSSFDTGIVSDMSGMFAYCSSLESLDLSSFDTWNVGDMSSMFQGCTNLVTIAVGEYFGTENCEQDEDMFDGCTKLIGGAGTTYSSDHTDSEYARIDNPVDDEPGYFTAGY